MDRAFEATKNRERPISTNPIVKRNIDTILTWLELHNRRDMAAIACFAEDIEITEMNTGVVYKGMAKMRDLARIAYRRKGWKDLTNLVATEDEACVEYIARADASLPLTNEEKGGVHGVDVSKAKPSDQQVTLPVCFVCHFDSEGKIDRVREYWDVSTLTRQFGIASLKARFLRFFLRHQ
jgi:ketosteroid isomerase-like protein